MQRNIISAWLFLAALGVVSAAQAQTEPVSSPTIANTSPGAPPSAEAQAEAARRFEHAVKLYGDAEYALALAEFERVYELVPDYRVLYNIGQVNMQVGRYARALRTLEEYLKRGADQVPAERAQQVKIDLESLAARVARIDVRVDQPGADVLVDGVSLGITPIAEPLVVDVGDRRLQVKRGGYRTWEQTLRLAGGDRRDLTLVLEREVVQPPEQPLPRSTPAPTRDVAQPAASKSSNLRWIGWTTAGVLGASAIVTGIAGAGAANDLAREQESSSTTRDKLDAAEARARGLLLATDLLAAAALATAGVTLYFELKAPGPGKREPVRAGTAQLALGLRGATLTVDY